jgi:hypothetical protein
MFRFVFAALLLPSSALAQQTFDGDFVYQSPQGPVTLSLQQQGSAVTGSMRGLDGSMFQLSGELFAQGARGQIVTGDGAGFFAVGFADNVLTLIVAEIDPATGQPDLANGWSLEFTSVASGGGGPFAGALGGRPGGTQPGAAPTGAQPGVSGTSQPAVERDPSLIGQWTYTERYNSGDFSANTTLQMLVNPDGTYMYGAGNVSLGGAYQGNTGNSGNVTRGQWRTEGGVVYIMEPGGTQWTAYARYYVEGTSVMFTFGDGSRQLWERVR